MESEADIIVIYTRITKVPGSLSVNIREDGKPEMAILEAGDVRSDELQLNGTCRKARQWRHSRCRLLLVVFLDFQPDTVKCLQGEVMENFTKLFDIASRAKNISCYEIANIIAAYLLMCELQGGSGLYLEWETEDRDGWNVGRFWVESYYDLLVVRTDTEQLNIPVPLLNTAAAISAYKHAAVVDRNMHNRKCRQPEPGETEQLWKELGAVLTRDDMKCLMWVLVGYKDRAPFAAALYEMAVGHLTDALPDEPGESGVNE